MTRTEYWVFIPDESSNIIHLKIHMKNQISALKNPLPNLGEILEKWYGLAGSLLKPLLMTLLLLLSILITVCVT